MTRIILETIVRAGADRCFDLSRDVSVHTGSTGASREHAVAGVTSGLLELGDEVTFEARHLGTRWRMTSRIAEFERPYRFVDEMRAGPFQRWRHEHVFVEQREGTLVIDRVEYRPLLWPLSWLVDLLFLRFYMRRLLEGRNRHLRAVAEAPRGPGQEARTATANPSIHRSSKGSR